MAKLIINDKEFQIDDELFDIFVLINREKTAYENKLLEINTMLASGFDVEYFKKNPLPRGLENTTFYQKFLNLPEQN